MNRLWKRPDTPVMAVTGTASGHHERATQVPAEFCVQIHCFCHYSCRTQRSHFTSLAQ